MFETASVGAMALNDFCKRYGVGRSYAYLEIKAGRLKALKAGARTLVRVADAEAWLSSRPSLQTAHAA
jgi:hypothetical protein